MTAELVKRHKSRYEKLKQKRASLDALFQELADVLHPDRADFIATNAPGNLRTSNIFDGTPMRARQGLATSIDGLIKPKTSRWFFGGTEDEDLNEMDEVKRWFSAADERMWNAIYSRPSRFIQRTGEVDNDLVTFGTGVLFIGENRDRNQLLFRSLHLRDVAIDENSDGVVDTVYVCRRMTARQAAQAYGEENLGDKTKEALREGKNKDTEFRFLWCVYPREEVVPYRRDNKNLPFASLVIDYDSDHLVTEEGFAEFPFAVPRWATSTGMVYGTSPGMIALPDANTLQAMGKTLLVAGQKACDPPLWATDDAIIGAARTFPGGITIIDSEAARNAGGQPFGVLQTGKDIGLGREMQNDYRQMVEAAFFRNVFNLPVDGPQMTAYEVAQRKEEFLRVMGPVFGQLEADYIGHIADRCFGILMRAGAFPPPPDILMGQEVKYRFQSPIQVARKQIEVQSMFGVLTQITPLIEVRPDILDNYELDEIARDAPEASGAPQKWLKSIAKRDEERAQRAQQMQEQQQLQGLQQVADVAATARKAMPSAA